MKPTLFAGGNHEGKTMYEMRKIQLETILWPLLEFLEQPYRKHSLASRNE